MKVYIGRMQIGVCSRPVSQMFFQWRDKAFSQLEHLSPAKLRGDEAFQSPGLLFSNMKYAMQGIYRNADYMRNMYYFDFMTSRRKKWYHIQGYQI
jgi:hypothetical protein